MPRRFRDTIDAVLTLLLYGVVAIVLAGALFLVAAFVLPAGEQIAPSIRDEPSWELPGKELDYDDIATARLPVALRGYRFAETDRLLDRLAEELRRRDEEIARLRAGAAEDQERWAPPEASVRTHSKHALEDRPEDADGA